LLGESDADDSRTMDTSCNSDSDRLCWVATDGNSLIPYSQNK